MAEIIRAEHSGFCFGVRQAIDKTIEQIELAGPDRRIFTCGQLIHNATVTNELAEKGVGIITEPEEAMAGDTVIVRSHGETEDFFVRAEQQGLNLVDATCPFVTKIHNLVRDAWRDGRNVIIIGDRDHPEVKGINGWCGNAAFIAGSGRDAEGFTGSEAFVVCQTTLNERVLTEVTEVLRNKGVAADIVNTICNATKERQMAADELSKKVDAMVVIGGRNSSNTRKLYEICKKNCDNSYFVENIVDLPLKELQKCNRIGVAAGASTPERVIKEVIANMLAANKTIAEHFFWMEYPFVYRVHEKPDPERIIELRAFLAGFGISLPGNPENIHPSILNKILDDVKGKPYENIVSTVIIRSMKKAYYSTSCDGHFGLSFKYYCHFTSPIRRYPDLMIHRIIKASITGRANSALLKKYHG